MKNLIILFFLAIVAISCKKAVVPEAGQELPLVYRGAHTTGFNVNLTAEVYPHVTPTGTFYSINGYASDTARAEYILTVRWTDGNGKVLTSDAIVHLNFSACITFTTIPATPYKVTDAKIIAARCSDARYKFTF